MNQSNLFFWGPAAMALNPQISYMTDWYNAWDAENNSVEYDYATTEIKANELLAESIQTENKQQAYEKLQATDWAATVDITDPVYSDPYLTNQIDFLKYRSAVRKILVNPPLTPVNDWPILPKAIWS